MGDINIDSLNRQGTVHSKLVSFCDVCGLSNLITTKACLTKNSSSSIDATLTNRPRCIQITSVLFETGFSGYHSPVIAVIKSHLSRLKLKVIKYCSFKRFDAASILLDVKLSKFFSLCLYLFWKLVDKHGPLRTKVERGNSALFMTLS